MSASDDDATPRARRLERKAELAQQALEARRGDLDQRLRRAERTLRRRLEAVRADRARIAQVPALRRDAGWLLGQLHALAPGQHELEIVDESVEPPATLRISIDPALGARRQADAWFARARKLERGAALAATREQATARTLAAVTALRERLTGAREDELLSAIAAEAEALGVEVAAGHGSLAPVRAKKPAERLPYREFKGSAGRRILVGRSAADNDRLTLDHARPHDLWLHARDSSGSHVVVPLQKNEACPPELLADAATLAAHFSQARRERVVDVIHVHRRHVRKPRKSPAGQVQVEREKVFRLQLEAERLERLLASERGKL